MDTLDTLTKLTQEVEQMATAQVPKTRTVDDKVADIVLGIDNRVLNFDNVDHDDDVKAIDDKGAAINTNTSYEDIQTLTGPSANAWGKRRQVETEVADCKLCSLATQQILSITPPQWKLSIRMTFHKKTQIPVKWGTPCGTTTVTRTRTRLIRVSRVSQYTAPMTRWLSGRSTGERSLLIGVAWHRSERSEDGWGLLLMAITMQGVQFVRTVLPVLFAVEAHEMPRAWDAPLSG